MITVDEVLANRKKIDQLYANKSRKEKTYHDEVTRIKDREYYDKIKALEHERDGKISDLTKEQDRDIKELDALISDQFLVVNKAKQILSFLRVVPMVGEAGDVNAVDVVVRKHGNDGYKEELDYLVNEELLKVKLFIIENTKPTNKYSLIAVGRCAFSEPLVKFPHTSSNAELHYKGFNIEHVNIEHVFREAPSVKELKTYLQRSFLKIMEEMTGSYLVVKREYLEAMSTYKKQNFQELIMWECPNCDNFYSIFDDRASGRDQPECYNHSPAVHMYSVSPRVLLRLGS